MIAEILSVGTELLMGQIANTDAKYISRRLSELGVTLYRHTTVGDNPRRVKEALQEALSRADMVITTGGLGPTEDDLTKEMVAEFFDLPMEIDPDSLLSIEKRMCKLGREMTENNKKQAYFPRGAIIMPNLRGTAPGCIVENGEKAVAVLPGPPRELEDMFDRQLAPYLQKKSGAQIESRFLRIVGVGESMVETKLKDLFHSENPTLALYCGPGEVLARISASVRTGEDAAELISPLAEEIYRRLGQAVYAEGLDNSLAKTVLNRLLARRETVAFAESLTGGRLAATFIDCPGASGAINEAYVTYSNEAKARLLGVRPETLQKFGAVSAECAKEMALGILRAAQADWAVSTTGIAGPGGGTLEQDQKMTQQFGAGFPSAARSRCEGVAALRQTPSDTAAGENPSRIVAGISGIALEKGVGLTYVGVARGDRAWAEEFHFTGDRDWVRTLACQNALNALRLKMLGER